MTFLQRVIVSLPGVVLLLMPLLREDGGRAPWLSVGFAVFYGCIALPLMLLQYMQFRYTITPREIVIRSGVATRRTRSIPVERVQNVEIVQAPLARLLGAAQVRIETAGSAKAEGVLDLVSLREAHEVRRLIRTYQLQPDAEPTHTMPPLADASAPAPAMSEMGGDLLLKLSTRRALLSGVYRFSLLYIALIFSGLQYLDLDPEAIARRLDRGELQLLADFAAASPWTAALLALASAVTLSWVTGVVIHFNRNHGFRLSLDHGKLHIRHGLLTVSERTLPVRRIQAMAFRSNPLMRRLNWWRVEVQTMGLDVQQQGHQVAAPFVRWEEALEIAGRIDPLSYPAEFKSVSRLMIRRATVRYALLVAAAAAGVGYFWQPGWWLFLLLPLSLLMARLSYRNHGYSLEEDALYVRRGVIRHRVWRISYRRAQAFFTSASVFQRRLGLKTVQVDTAGARSGSAAVTDLAQADADWLVGELYARYQAQSSGHRRREAADLNTAAPAEAEHIPAGDAPPE